ncbi:MAG TPA: ATP-binding protein [Flavisolibacter sp.]|nr:ATP-binding protein [Flavisolibacter sp.]
MKKQQGIPIRSKIMRVILVTCGAVLLLTCTAFFTYEFITYRDFTKNELSTIGKIVASNSTAALAFDSKEDADEILGALRAQKHIAAAVLYDSGGRVFAFYPHTLSPEDIPEKVPVKEYRFKGGFLEGVQPVIQEKNQLGNLYLKADMKAVYSRFLLYGVIAVLFTILSFVFAYLISKRLQRSISDPILDLAEIARQVSDKSDYSVRAVKRSGDEVGVLTDAFNHMLQRIQLQSEEISLLNINLEEKVAVRTRELQHANLVLAQQNEFTQTIIDSSVDLIAVFDRDMRFLILNKRADEVYYPLTRDEMIGKGILEVFPSLKNSAMTDSLGKALKGEFIHHDTYKSIVSGRYFENFFIPLQNDEGQTDRVLVIGHDITNIMQANEQLRKVNSDLEKSNRDLEQFAYVASHDLQEPLRKIQTFSELSERNMQYPEILGRYLQKINSSAARMTELIKAVLNYSRLTRKEKDFALIDLNAIVEQIKVDLELVIEERAAIITAAPLPSIEGHPLQIHQLFLNLITNSLKFSEKPPRISISARKVTGGERKDTKPDADYLELVFKDNGIGFEQQYADQIFAIFQRLHSGSQYAGTGIGLAVCKKIVENHQGAIYVESQAGEGTSFYVLLPVPAGEGQAATSAPGKEESGVRAL